MKQRFLESFEEKFYFRTSRIFWHILAGIGGLALLGGAAIFLWSLTPSLKPNVKKPAYPPPVAVSTMEIKQIIAPAEPKVELAVAHAAPVSAASAATATDQIAPADSSWFAYQTALDSMRALLPPERFRWESFGHWQQTFWERKWMVDYIGIQERIESITRQVNAHDLREAARLLQSYIALVHPFPVELRFEVLKSAMEFSKDDVATTIQNIALLRAAAPHFSIYDEEAIAALATFGRKNPRDGRRFIEYTNGLLPSFEQNQRLPLLQTLISGYYNYFNDIARQEEATNLFLAIQKDFEPGQQAHALNEFYRLYRERNMAREQQIAAMEAGYQNELALAENVVAEKKSRKAFLRAWGWKITAASVGAIAFLALLLVLLSIQRNIKMLREVTMPGG